MRFFNFLYKPYPFNDDLKHNAKVILFISLGVLAFLLAYQPVEISTLSSRELFYLAVGVALSTFLLLTLNLIVLPSFFPKVFNSTVWNIKREILWNIWILFTISGSDLIFYSRLFEIFEMSFYDIIKIMLLGLLPVAVLVIINHQRLLQANLRSARELNRRLMDRRKQQDKLIDFQSDYKNDVLSVRAGSLILIKSADNYIEVYYEGKGSVKKQMVRSSLKRAEEAVKHFDFIFKCHRTFIVNLHYIKEIQGRPNGYPLYLTHLDFPVMVSQNFVKPFNKII